MKRADGLFQLIHSLTPAEKRFFKVFGSRHVIGEENNYLKLFDALAEQATYDEAALKERFRDSKFIRHLTSEKTYLKQLILRAMRLYHEQNAPAYQVACQLQEARFLRKKGLNGQARSALRRAKKLAARYEAFPQWLALLDLERDLEKEADDKQTARRLQAIQEENDDVLEHLLEQQRFMARYDEMFRRVYRELRHRRSAQIAALESFFDSEDVTDGASFRTQLYMLQTRAVYFQLKGDYASARAHYAQVLLTWEAHPHQQRQRVAFYRRSIANFLAISGILDRYDEFPAHLDKLARLPADAPAGQAEHFSILRYYELLYLMNTHQLDAARALVPRIAEGLTTYLPLLPLNRVMGFRYNLGVLHFVLEDFAGALHWLNQLRNVEKTDTRADLQQAAGILVLICHFELENDDLLPYLLRNYRRSLRTRDRLHAFEKLLIGFLKKAVLRDPNRDAVADFAALLHALKAIDETGLPGLDETLLWAKSRTGQSPIRHLFTR